MDRTLSERVERLEKYAGLNMPGTQDYEAAGQQRIDFNREAQADYNRRQSTTDWYADKVAGHQEQAVRSTTAFEEIMNRIQGATDRICRQAGKLEEIGTRILGPLPQDDEASKGVGITPDGTLDHTFLALNWLDSSICRLEQAALRMERI